MDIPYLFYPFAGEDFDGGAGHVDVVVGGPLDFQRSAGQVDRRAAPQAIRQYARYADGTRPRAAGLCGSAAALP